MKIERIKKSLAAHNIECWTTLVIKGYVLQKPMVIIAFRDRSVPTGICYMHFVSYAEAYRYCKRHDLLSLSRRKR